MKKIKKCMIAIVVFATVIINSTGCESKPIMDEDKCAEVALEYMKTKYNEDFEVAYKYEVRRVFGSAGYVEVDVRIKGKEKEYCVIVYPDKKKKNDKAYVSYKVVSDNYMSGLVENVSKSDLDNIVNQMKINEYISDISVYEICKIDGFCGFSSEFYISNENDTLNGLLENENVCITYRIEVPENEFNKDYEKYFKEILKSKISDDSISISIVSYPEETFAEREKIYKESGYEKLNMLKGTDEIDFFIEEDETNEFK